MIDAFVHLRITFIFWKLGTGFTELICVVMPKKEPLLSYKRFLIIDFFEYESSHITTEAPFVRYVFSVFFKNFISRISKVSLLLEIILQPFKKWIWLPFDPLTDSLLEMIGLIHKFFIHSFYRNKISSDEAQLIKSKQLLWTL